MSHHLPILSQPNTYAAAAAIMPVQQSLKLDLPINALQHLPLQTKLSVGAVNDPLEEEADAMADKVMRMPEAPFIQRKCAHCKEEEQQIQRKPLSASITPFIQTKSANSGTASDSLTNQINTTKGSGNTIDAATKSFMESRFGTDFSNVNIHTDKDAVQMNAALNAQAFTMGNDIYFNAGKYSPNHTSGKHLLAHELTHVIQQSNTKNSAPFFTEKISFAKEPHIARFTDDTHHIIDEAALTGGGFTEDQIKDIEKGNKLRDYSQLPKIGNAVLLCDYNSYGGYDPAEHFDNYIWDKEKNEWRDRSLLANQRAGIVAASVRGSDPIAHIKNELTAFVSLGLTKNGLPRLGNAFHAVEDFFAHSNFVELINNDFRFGHELLTGSVPGTGAVSILHTAEDVSAKDSAAYFKAQGEEAKKDTDILSHANIAKDHLGDRNHIQARRLAALVVQELSSDLLKIFKSPPEGRMQLLESIVFKKIDRYLRFPDASKDAWWIALIASDNGVIDQLLEKAESETPATVNQCFLSPLRNLEASKDANMKIVIGAAIPVKLWGSHGFIQVGGGLVTPLNLDGATITSDRNDKPAWFVGGQVTWRFK